MDDTQNIFLVACLAIMSFLVLVGVFVFVFFLRVWLRALLHGAPVPIIQIVAMRLRGNPPRLLIDAYIALKRADFGVTNGDVENAYIDGRSHVSTSDNLVELIKKRANGR